MATVRKTFLVLVEILWRVALIMVVGFLPAVVPAEARAEDASVNVSGGIAPRVDVRVGSTLRDHLRRVLNADAPRQGPQGSSAQPQHGNGAFPNQFPPQFPGEPNAEGDVAIGFSPGNATGLVLNVVNSATRTLDVAAYEFTHKEIAEAIVAASRRGVRVRVLIDRERSTGNYNAAQFFANSGVSTKVSNPRYKIFHHKFMVVDGQTLQTGSFNYTSAAARGNAENVIVLLNAPSASRRFTQEFDRLWNESDQVRGRY